MEDKIRKYVEYHFRFKKGKEKDELVEEVYTNLLDRFNALKEDYGDEEKAYRETIARMGDFSKIEADDNPEYSLLPRVYDVGLIVALALSVFGLVAIFLHSSLAFILTVVSIVIFVASAYYIYHKAQYEKNVNGDIDTFHLYLDKSFSYLKTVFIFWALTFTILLGLLFAGIFTFMSGVNNAMEAFSSPGQLVLAYLLSFLVAAALIGGLFYLIYTKIMEHYRYISGKSHLEGSFQKGLGMLRLQRNTVDLSKAIKLFVPWFMLLIVVISLMAPMMIRIGSIRLVAEGPALTMMFELIQPRYFFSGGLLLIAYAFTLYSIINSIRHEGQKLFLVLISMLGTSAAFIIVDKIVDIVSDTRRLTYPSQPDSLNILIIGSIITAAYLIFLRIKGFSSRKTE